MRKSIIICGLLLLCIHVNAQHTFYRTEYKHFSDALLMEANQGNAMALNDLGSCYDRADGVPQDRQKAFECFQEASEKGWFLAHYNLAQYYYKGFACEQNHEKAVELLNKTLEKDSKFAPAQWHLAECYYNGLGTAKNMVKALELYKKCEIAKHPNLDVILSKIAGIYEKGINGIPYYENAFQYWVKLAEMGERNKVVGEYKVGEYYNFGRGVERNQSEAISWYTKAANKNHAPSQLNLANCYIPNDYQKVVFWLTKAYENNYLAACHNLADCYFYGNGVEQSYEKAFEIFQKGISYNPRCLYRLGVMYREGLGVAVDNKKGEQLLVEAAEKGIASAQYLVGMDMYNGENISQNYKEAVRYFELALKDQYLLNDARGEIMRKLSACYRFGRGVSVDVEKADYYMKEAARYGDADAQKLQEYLHLK